MTRVAQTDGLRRRLGVLATLLVAMNVAAWAWALLALHGHPALLGIALAVYGLGLRHAVDADHIAAIDNVVRKLMQEGKRPAAVGFFFALGHSAIVIIFAAAVACATTLLGGLQEFQRIGGLIGTGVSTLFLLAIAGANIVIFAGLCRSLRRIRQGGAGSEAELEALLNGRGLLARAFRPLFRLVSESWHMLPIGILFGLGFDTATEVAMFGVSASEAAHGLPVGAILVFPALFAAGMTLLDTADGVAMLGAYRWAFLKPVRKLYYNMAITFASVAVALLVAGVEALGLLSGRLGWQGRFWDDIGLLNANWNTIGFIIVGVFLAAWAISVAIYRRRTQARVG